MGFRNSLLLLTLVGVLSAVVIAIVAAFGLGALRRDAVDQLALTEAVRRQMSADMLHDGLRGSVYSALYAASVGDTAGTENARAEVQDNGAELLATLQALAAAPLGDALGERIGSNIEVAARYVGAAEAVVNPAAAGDLAAAQAALPDYESAFAFLLVAGEALGDALQQHGEAELAAAERSAQWASTGMLATFALFTLLQFVLGFVIGKRLIGMIGGEPSYGVEALRRIAEGDLDTPVRTAVDGPSLLFHLRQMAQQLKARLEDERNGERAKNARIRAAVEASGTGIMLTDAERRIVFANPALSVLLQGQAEELRRHLPDIAPGALVDSHFDRFHPAPVELAATLARLRATHRMPLQIGAAHFGLKINAVDDADGARLGYAIEWQDQTTEVAMRRRIAELIEAAADGDVSQRLATEGLDGFFATLAEGLNRTLAGVEQSIDEVSASLAALGKGDLTRAIERPMGGAFGRMKDNVNTALSRLRGIIAQVKGAAGAIDTASGEIATGNGDLSRRTEQQAASLEETASSMEELTAAVQHNASNARQARQVAAGTVEVARRGGDVVGEVVQTMAAISASSKKIEDIISVIDGIAFQTNILALNAAVEAARAGDQGRGFAVVATEVRALAQRSAAAAKEIKLLIANSARTVLDGSALVQRAGSTMQEIVGSVHQVTTLIGEIAAASDEQSSGILQVNDTVTQLDHMTQQNAALVEEASAAASALASQASLLNAATQMFVIDAAGARAAEGAIAGFPDMILAHRNWRERLLRYAAGDRSERLAADQIAQDHHCALGQWIHGQGRRLAALPVYRELVEQHAAFHRCAGHVVRCVDRGDRGAAEQLIDDALNMHTTQVIAAINAVEREVGESAAASGAAPAARARRPLDRHAEALLASA